MGEEKPHEDKGSCSDLGVPACSDLAPGCIFARLKLDALLRLEQH
jgi:hypothetical protein